MRKPFTQFPTVDSFTLSVFRITNYPAFADIIIIPGNLSALAHKHPL